MKANEFLSAIKTECGKHKMCNKTCPFYISDGNVLLCRIHKVIGLSPVYIDFEESTVTSTETIELPAKFDSIPNLKIKAENVYINVNGGD
jgi:hypothetical protein